MHLVKHQMDCTRLDQSFVRSISGSNLRTSLCRLWLSGRINITTFTKLLRVHSAFCECTRVWNSPAERGNMHACSENHKDSAQGLFVVIRQLRSDMGSKRQHNLPCSLGERDGIRSVLSPPSVLNFSKTRHEQQLMLWLVSHALEEACVRLQSS